MNPGLLRLVCLAAALCGPAHAQLAMSDVQPLATPSARRTQGLRVDMPQPLMFFLKGDTAPSCGLRATAHASVVLPMVQAAPGEAFPACEAVTHAQSFVLLEGNATAYRLRQRDTREDVSTVHFFALQRSSGGPLEPLPELNEAEVPSRLDMAAVATWAKAQRHSQADSAAGFAAQSQHSIVAGAWFMNLARNASTGVCRIVLGQRDTKDASLVLDSPCRSVLGSSQLLARGHSWWLALLDTADGARQLHMFQQQGNVVQRSVESETRLAPLAAQGLAAVKAALRSGVR